MSKKKVLIAPSSSASPLSSSYLREFSHGKDMERIIKDATEVINYVKSKGLEVRFSSEDSFRSDLVDLLNLYKAVDQLGVNRVGIADTVGCANPRQVYDLVKTLRSVLKPTTDIECHFHNGKHLNPIPALFSAPLTRNTFHLGPPFFLPP